MSEVQAFDDLLETLRSKTCHGACNKIGVCRSLSYLFRLSVRRDMKYLVQSPPEPHAFVFTLVSLRLHIL